MRLLNSLVMHACQPCNNEGEGEGREGAQRKGEEEEEGRREQADRQERNP